MIRKFTQFFFVAALLVAGCSSKKDTVTSQNAESATASESASTAVASNTPDSAKLGSGSSGYGH